MAKKKKKDAGIDKVKLVKMQKEASNSESEWVSINFLYLIDEHIENEILKIGMAQTLIIGRQTKCDRSPDKANLFF